MLDENIDFKYEIFMLSTKKIETTPLYGTGTGYRTGKKKKFFQFAIIFPLTKDKMLNEQLSARMQKNALRLRILKTPFVLPRLKIPLTTYKDL